MKFEFADMIEEYGVVTPYKKKKTGLIRGKPNNIVEEVGEATMLIYPATPAEVKMYAGGEYITEAFKVKTLRELVLKHGDKINHGDKKCSVFYVKDYGEHCDFYEYYIKRDVG